MGKSSPVAPAWDCPASTRVKGRVESAVVAPRKERLEIEWVNMGAGLRRDFATNTTTQLRQRKLEVSAPAFSREQPCRLHKGHARGGATVAQPARPLPYSLRFISHCQMAGEPIGGSFAHRFQGAKIIKPVGRAGDHQQLLFNTQLFKPQAVQFSHQFVFFTDD